MNFPAPSDFEGVRFSNHLEAGDIGSIIALHGKLYFEEYGFGLGFEKYVARTFADFVCQFQKGKDEIWLAKENQQVKGCIALVHRGAREGQLRYFITSIDYRKKGLGRFLFGLFMNHVRASGYSQIYLWTTSNLKAAAHLYLQEGFYITEERQSETFGIPLLEQKYSWKDLRR
ncbi:GNAT family N-acetyltransferase [Cyclobacterium jeungdonense]|uniref:GNAT family N-acetyltransferase n=1 Tax=Cyclobacterium jeungdonense TaxID=708087 RepID=A0ABT8C642_9BACT|nr:GNAT family N-acetyltransferase [Cyclobacterium jeungdonense]MDN3687950.1 GNAT family N-acetyltransferase [Cyclobacterium jeungdonense]